MKKEKQVLETDFKKIPVHAKNVDEQGNVLYLDEKILEEREGRFPKFKNSSNGLGIENFMRKHLIYVSYKNKKTVIMF